MSDMIHAIALQDCVGIMQSFNLEQIITAWTSITENVFVPHTEEEYEHLVDILDCLIDQVGEDETHSLLIPSHL